MENKQLYSWSENSETYHGEFYTEQEAINEAIEDMKKLFCDEFEFYIGVCEKPVNPTINVDNVIDDIIDSFGSEYGDFADGYLMDVSKSELEELENALNATLLEWAKKHKHMPEFFTVEEYNAYRYKDGKYEKVGRNV